MATSSVYGKIRENSDDKESSRKKEVDDLISKYARKKAPPPPPPPTGAAPRIPAQNMLQRDYSSSSLKFGASRENVYGQRDSLYGQNSLYGGASSSNLYGQIPRRSSQYEVPSYPEPIYESAAQPTTARQQKYLATSKSSSNLYLQPQYGSGAYGEPGNTRSMGRQQKTLSMHGTPSSGASGRNNAVMETAANIIANAHQSGVGLGTTSDWWSGNQLTTTYGPTPLQHDWSQKNNLWNPAAAAAVSSGGSYAAGAPGVGPIGSTSAVGSSSGGHPLAGHSAVAPASLPVLKYCISSSKFPFLHILIFLKHLCSLLLFESLSVLSFFPVLFGILERLKFDNFSFLNVNHRYNLIFSERGSY